MAKTSFARSPSELECCFPSLTMQCRFSYLSFAYEVCFIIYLYWSSHPPSSFGLSHSVDPLKSHVSGYHLGTPFYAAPEIALTGKVTKSSDVFSFGILMAEIYK